MSEKDSLRIHLVPRVAVLLVFLVSSSVPVRAASTAARVAATATATATPLPTANFRRIDERDGLSHPAVYGIAQDSFGFMWLGTLEGLDRFDGANMRAFRPDPPTTGVTCGGPKVAVYADHQDRIWSGSIGHGACMYDALAGAWRAYFAPEAAEPGAEAVTVRDFLEDEQGTLWMATSAGLARLPLGSATPSLLRHDPQDANSLAHDDVYALALDSAGMLWIGTRDGADAFDPATEQFTHYRNDPADPQSLSSNRVFDVLADRAGSVWLATWDGGLNRLDPRSGAIRSFRHAAADPNSLSSDQLMKLLEDSAGRLWIGTYGGGLDLYDAEADRFVHYQHADANPNSLSHNNVVALFEDRTGTLWVGTEGAGISMLNLFPLPFTMYGRAGSGENTIAPGLVMAVAEDGDGKLLIGTNAGGVTRLDRSRGEFTYWQADPNTPGSLASNVVASMLYASAGVLWIGTSQGLNRYDAATGTFSLYQHDPHDPNSLSDNSVYQILEDDDGTLWLGTYGGLDHFDPATGQFTHYSSDPQDPGTLSSNIVRVLMPGAGDDLWIGTQNSGLNRLDRASGQITRYRSAPADPTSLSGNSITGLARDRDGLIWVAADDAGLNRLDPQTGLVRRYGAADGLVASRIMALAFAAATSATGADALWMSTDGGLARFDLQAETFSSYDSSDGLPHSDFVPYAVYRGRQDEIFFGSLDGVVAFRPAEIKDARLLPAAQVAELYINNQPAPIGGEVLPKAIFAADAIHMPAGAQAITFLFSAPGYWDAHNVRFRFRLQGFQQDWIKAQPMQRGATYMALAPGSYVFQLQAAGRSREWNAPGRQVALVLEPAWWQLWWVRPLAALAAVAFVVAAIVSGFQTRLRITRRRNELLEREVAARTTELSALLSVSQSLTSERDLDPLLVQVLDYVRRAIPHKGGILLLRSGNAAEVEAYSVAGKSSTAIGKSSVKSSTFHAVATFIGAGKLFRLPELNGSAEDIRALADLAGDQASGAAWIAAPMLEHGVPIGGLLLYDVESDPFDDDDLPKLQRFANQLAIALENVRLQTQAQRLAVDLERSRLSRELHDSVTQLLHSISLHANAAERALALGRPAHGAENMRQAQRLAQEAIHELRTLIFELRLTPLEKGGLQAALRAYLDTVVARSGIAVHLDARTQRRWSQDVEFELYRIAQEALTNVVKHAAATRVVVSLHECHAGGETPCTILEIMDNGVGFDTAAAQSRGTVGLHSMAERAKEIGASFTVRSQVDRGTTVRVDLRSGVHGSSEPG